MKHVMKFALSLMVLFTVACQSKQTPKEVVKTDCSSKTECTSSCGGCSNSCQGQKAEVAKLNSEDLNVVYFHGTRRCVTCQTVEKVAKAVAEQEKNNGVTFLSVNREEEASHDLVDKFHVSGQTLLVVKGEEVVNLTNTAFLNARTKPEVFEKELLAAIEKLN